VHTSWSPEEHQRQYEYTPDFIWSNTVQQASAACANYFLWNDFLTGGNDDTPEGGYADRNYYGRALACSLAALNRRPLASAGMWGMPAPVRKRMLAINHVFGAGGHPAFRSVVDYAPRQTDVLFLYPQDLTAVDERFGSWVVQYGYANLITAEKLVEHGQVAGDGLLAVKDARYRAVCVLYEPFPSGAFLKLLQTFAENGGIVVWTSVPPMLCQDGAACREAWMRDLFGVVAQETVDPLGLALPARQVDFHGALAPVAPMSVLTDLTVDRLFPVSPLPGTECVARVRTGGPDRLRCVGTRKAYPGGGQALYLGFRLRDDQSASTGWEARTWFEVLQSLGVYAPSGVFDENDNPSVVSRNSGYLACAFPNGAVALCPHYRHHAESWPGGFFRENEQDERLLAENPPPDDCIDLVRFRVAGHEVTYRGQHAVAWRLDNAGCLLAFAGVECTGIALDGWSFAWADKPVDIAWHALGPEHETPVYRPLYRAWCDTEGEVRVPLGLEAAGLEVWAGALKPTWRGRGRGVYGRVGYGYRQVSFSIETGALCLDIDAQIAGCWLYVVRQKA
jgi:hypothetical protein